MIKFLNDALDWLIKACAILACVSIGLMTFFISLEVVLRSFFLTTMEFTDEYSGYMVLAVCALGVAYCREKNSLLTVDFIIVKLPPELRRRVEFIYNLVALAFSLMITYYMTKFLISTIERGLTAGTMQRTPLWIPQMLIPFGFALLSLVIFRKLFRPDGPAPSELDIVMADLK